MVDVRISTWNCFGQGQGLDAVRAQRAPHGARFLDRALVEECGTADVFCIQELMSREAEDFFDKLGHAGVFRDHNRMHLRSVTMRGSGLGIGARRKLVTTALTAFGGPSAGWDRLARKGCLHARLSLAEGMLLDVLNVHTQSGYDAGAIAARAHQLEAVARAVRELGSPDRPFVVCGDFNICGLAATRDPEYPRLRAALPGFEDLGAADDLPTYHPEGNPLAQAFEPGGPTRRLDYVFFRPAPGLELVSVQRIFDRPLASALFPSDHYGLSATFRLV
jgi:endonuclease/exonuclease/phosphatase family metal-dependent hydrolase